MTLEKRRELSRSECPSISQMGYIRPAVATLWNLGKLEINFWAEILQFKTCLFIFADERVCCID